MKNVLYFNGFLIQALYGDEWSQDYPNYYGTGRYISWPLQLEEDDISKELTDEANQRWFYHTYFGEDAIDGDTITETIGNLEYLTRYINHCNKLGISTRILQIQTTRDYPLVKDIELMKGEILGYDYASGTSFTSLLMEDLDGNYKGEYSRLEQFERKLNKNGLIDSIVDIKKYVSIRQQILDKGLELENLGAMLIMLVTDVTKNFSILVKKE